MKKAIILAAGKSERLGDLTKDIPKCLLLLDEKNTIIDYLLSALKDVDCSEVTVVTGFEGKKVETHLNKKWRNDFQLNYIQNDQYDKSNNIYSAYLARVNWDDDTVLLNSDILINPKILKNLTFSVKLTKGKMSYLVIDDQKDLTEESVKVIASTDNEIKQIRKTLNPKNANGEYIGIAYLRGNERIKFLSALEDNIKEKNLNLFYEDAIEDILVDSIVLPCVVGELKWIEVDSKEDYDLAKKLAKSLYKEPVS